MELYKTENRCDDNDIKNVEDLIKEYSHLPGVNELINVLHKHKPN